MTGVNLDIVLKEAVLVAIWVAPLPSSGTTRSHRGQKWSNAARRGFSCITSIWHLVTGARCQGWMTYLWLFGSNFKRLCKWLCAYPTRFPGRMDPMQWIPAINGVSIMTWTHYDFSFTDSVKLSLPKTKQEQNKSGFHVHHVGFCVKADLQLTSRMCQVRVYNAPHNHLLTFSWLLFGTEVARRLSFVQDLDICIIHVAADPISLRHWQAPWGARNKLSGCKGQETSV